MHLGRGEGVSADGVNRKDCERERRRPTDDLGEALISPQDDSVSGRTKKSDILIQGCVLESISHWHQGRSIAQNLSTMGFGGV